MMWGARDMLHIGMLAKSSFPTHQHLVALPGVLTHRIPNAVPCMQMVEQAPVCRFSIQIRTLQSLRAKCQSVMIL